MPSLRDKTISGIFWSLLQNVGGKGITFLVMIVLARLLTPKIFGLIGMLMIFIQVSQVLVQAGFNQALIQKKETDEEDYSSVFWINLAASLILYAILFFCAPLIAVFYRQPVLTNLVRTLSLVFVINAFSYVQEAKISKEMRFKTLTIVHIPSTIIGGVVGIVMAVKGFGVWSIIALQLVTRFAYSVQIWIYAKWKPLLKFNREKAWNLFSFGGKLMVSAIIDTIYRNIYLVVIGRFFPVTAVGYYQNANNLVRTPSSTFSNALNKVAFPAFSSIQNDDERLKAGFKKIIQQVFYWLCPAFILSGVLAYPLFNFIFGEKWLPAVPYFQWLCVVGIFLPINLYNLSIVNVKGRSDLFLKLEIVKKILVTIGVTIAVFYGVMALLAIQAILSVVQCWINGHFSGKFINYSIWEQMKDILPILIISILSGTLVWAVNQNISFLPDILQVIVGVVIGAGFYWMATWKLKLAPYLEFKNIVQTKLLKHFIR